MIQNILVVVDTIDENAGSGSKMNIALIQNLVKGGFNVTVLHYSRKEIVIENTLSINIPEITWSILYLLGKVVNIISRSSGLHLNHSIERFIGFSFSFLNDSNSIARSLRKGNYDKQDLIITLSQGASFRPHHALLKTPQLYTKWLAYIHDPYPFHLYPRPYQFYQDGYKQKEKFFKKMSQTAQYFAFPSLLLKEWMAYTFPSMQQRGVVIPHQISANLPVAEHTPIRVDPSKFTLVHAGSATHQRSPIGLLKGFVHFLKNNPDAKTDCELYLLGPTDYSIEKLNEAAYYSPQVKINTAKIPFNEAYQSQQYASVNIILEAQSSISPFLPGKFAHCVQADKPILLLCPYYAETRRLLGENYPFWSEANDVEKIALIIENLYQIWKTKPHDMQLNRFDLIEYCGYRNLKIIIENTLS